MVRRRLGTRRAWAAMTALMLAAAAVAAPARARAQESTEAAAPPPPPAAAVLNQGMEVVVALTERVRSGEAKTGQEVRFRVANDVRSLDMRTVVVPAGTQAVGTILESRGAGAFGRPGVLRLTCDRILLPGGVRIPLAPGRPLDARGRSNRGASVGTGVVFGLLTLAVTSFAINFDLFEGGSSEDDNHVVPVLAGVGAGAITASFWRGRNVTLEPGKAFTVTVAADTPVGDGQTLPAQQQP